MSQTNYQTMNLKDLKTLLKTMNIKGVSKLNKKQILALLNQREKVKKTTTEPKTVKKTTTKPKTVKKTTTKPKTVKKTTTKPKKVFVITDKPLEKKQLGELKLLCRENNVKGFSKMKKKEIVSLLKFYEEQKVVFEHPVHNVFSETDDVVEPTEVLDKMTLKQLKKLAKSYKLKKYSKLNRNDIMTFIQSRTLLSSVEKIQMKLKKMNMKTLKALCKELKLKGYSKLNKSKVVELVMTKNVIPEPVEEVEQVQE